MSAPKTLIAFGAVSALAMLCVCESFAQAPAQPAQAPAAGAPAAGAAGGRGGRGGGGGRGPAEIWYINKGKGGVYTPPHKPLWKVADLIAAHRGQNTWSEQIIKDGLQDVTYNSAAPGTKITPRMHIEAAVAFVIIRGEMHFTVEGQQPVTATRGGIVNIMEDTIYSYDITGSQNALWVEIHPYFYQTVTPASEAPPPPQPGKVLTKVSFAHRPGAYTGTNKLYSNLWEALDKCTPLPRVTDDHIQVNPLLGFVNPADNKCNPGQTGNIGSGPLQPGAPPFNPNSTFGHLHESNIEWWVVQAGQIRGQFEGTGEFHATEGDVLYAAPDMWHQMAAEAPSGPNVRTAMSAYPITNMGNTENAGGGRGGAGGAGRGE
ncbi:MAG: cupin domain-containing protein [Alphaproteobacteria bacterium]|nr:cupin domain-containing protein [Alphaproteobacteria bacterium]